MALLVGALCAGCSGGVKAKGTPTGAHQVTITGTSGTTTHNISVLLTVEQEGIERVVPLTCVNSSSRGACERFEQPRNIL